MRLILVHEYMLRRDSDHAMTALGKSGSLGLLLNCYLLCRKSHLWATAHDSDYAAIPVDRPPLAA